VQAENGTDFAVLQNELKGQVDQDRPGRLRSAQVGEMSLSFVISASV
jgi:hypothetical protein